MKEVLKSLLSDQVLVYLDIVKIFSKTIKEHIERLRTEYSRIKTHNLKLKPTKCYKAEKEVKFLEYIVNKDRVQPGPEIGRVIRNMFNPFISMAIYYRMFIRNFTQLTYPLRQLIT